MKGRRISLVVRIMVAQRWIHWSRACDALEEVIEYRLGVHHVLAREFIVRIVADKITCVDGKVEPSFLRAGKYRNRLERRSRESVRCIAVVPRF